MKAFVIQLFFLLYMTKLLVSHTDQRVLNVGEELQKETLLLEMGSRLYKLQGINSNTWYEVKISYPASIPASFSIQLSRGNLSFVPRHQRKLLNTEKLIFKADSGDLLDNQDELYVLVTVEPAGVVAIPHAKEREYVIFNIVCDELLLGIPYGAWWVTVLVIICLALAMVIPSFLPSFLLPAGESPATAPHVHSSKDS